MGRSNKLAVSVPFCLPHLSVSVSVSVVGLSDFCNPRWRKKTRPHTAEPTAGKKKKDSKRAKSSSSDGSAPTAALAGRKRGRAQLSAEGFEESDSDGAGGDDDQEEEEDEESRLKAAEEEEAKLRRAEKKKQKLKALKVRLFVGHKSISFCKYQQQQLRTPCCRNGLQFLFFWLRLSLIVLEKIGLFLLPHGSGIQPPSVRYRTCVGFVSWVLGRGLSPVWVVAPSARQSPPPRSIGCPPPNLFRHTRRVAARQK